MTRIIAVIICLSLALIAAPRSIEAQTSFDISDPLKGDRMLVPSQEIIALRADPVLTMRLHDAIGDVAQGGTTGPTVVTPPTGYRGGGYDFDGINADFDGDGLKEFAHVYEATDGSAYTRVVDIDDGVVSTPPNATRALNAMGGEPHKGQLRLLAGNTHGDSKLELILTTWEFGKWT